MYFNIVSSVPENNVSPKRTNQPVEPIRALLNLRSPNRKWDDPLDVYVNILSSVPKTKVWPKRTKRPLRPIGAVLNVRETFEAGIESGMTH